jgi:hypothetical protein
MSKRSEWKGRKCRQKKILTRHIYIYIYVGVRGCPLSIRLSVHL